MILEVLWLVALVFVTILFIRDSVLACLLIQLPFHQDVKKERHSCSVCKFTVYVNSPEERMLLGILSIWETYKINGHMTQDILIIQTRSNGRANFHQIYLRQTSLWGETTGIYHFTSTEFVMRANQLDVTIWFNKKRDRRIVELVYVTKRRSTFDDSTNPAKLCNVLIPASIVERRLSKFDFLGQYLRKSPLESLYNLFSHLYSASPQLLYGLKFCNIERGMTSCSKLIIYLKDPDVHIKILDDKPCQSQFKFTLILDVVGAHWYWYVTHLEDAFCSTLCRINDISSGQVRLSA